MYVSGIVLPTTLYPKQVLEFLVSVFTYEK